MIKRVSIIGAGGLGRDMASIMQNDTKFDFEGFWDDNFNRSANSRKWNLLGNIDDLCNSKFEHNIIIGVGNPSLRFKLYERLVNLPIIKFVSWIHESVIIADMETVKIGEGSFIFPNCMLTTNVEVGANTIIHAYTSLHHDVSIGGHSVIMPGVKISGGASIGKRSYLHTGYISRKKVQIPDDYFSNYE